MSMTYYVALPFVEDVDGALTAGQAQECPTAPSAIRRAEAMARDPKHAGALAFQRSGDPSLGRFGDATLLKSFGIVPDRLEEF